MTYSVKILPAAEKDLSGIPKRDRERLGKRIDSLSDDPRPVIADRMKGWGRTFYKIRSGEFRVVCEIDDAGRVVIILVAGDRKDIYQRAKRRLT